MEQKKKNFNEWLLGILNWVGGIGAVVTAVAYLILIVVLVVGIKVQVKMDQLILVSVIGAVAGLTITWMLKGQGVSLASNEPKSKQVTKAYKEALNKDTKTKSLHTIKWHLFITGLSDILIKGVMLAVTTFFAVSIFAQGNGDITLIGLAAVNILMFTSFGLLAMSKSYFYYVTTHLDTLVELTKRINENPTGVSTGQGE